MQYKILILKNRYNKTLNIKKYVIDWFKLHTPLEVTTEEMVTDFDITAKEVSNGKVKGVVCGDDIYAKIRTVVPPNKYNCVVFIYGNDLNGIRVSTASGELYPSTEFVQTFIGDDNGMTINHEMFHAFFFKVHKLQIDVVDNMDTYIGNKDLSVDSIANTNREIALQTLKPYWKQICTITPPIIKSVVLTRKTSTNKQTLGTLEARNGDAILYCKTLELPFLNNQVNISCIPTGIYNVKLKFSLKLGYVYEIQNVKGRTSIYLHSGNYAWKSNTKNHIGDIQGCILLGNDFKDINGDGNLDIINSKITINAFRKLMNDEPFTIEIR